MVKSTRVLLRYSERIEIMHDDEARGDREIGLRLNEGHIVFATERQRLDLAIALLAGLPFNVVPKEVE